MKDAFTGYAERYGLTSLQARIGGWTPIVGQLTSTKEYHTEPIEGNGAFLTGMCGKHGKNYFSDR